MPDMIKFNTGRLYAANGQPIVAIKVGRVVCFYDHARMIEGFFVTDEPLTDRAVMEAYNSGTYEPSYHTIDPVERDDALAAAEAMYEELRPEYRGMAMRMFQASDDDVAMYEALT